MSNTVSSFKPSKAIRLLLMVLFVCLFANVVSAQTNTWDGSSNNNWNTAANWSLNAVPTNVHDVVINSNAAISVDTNATINSLNISNSAVVSFTSSGGARTITIDNTGSSIGLGSTLTLQGSTGSGTRSMTLAYTVANQAMSIAGTLALTNVGDGAIYNASNSVTTVTGTIINSKVNGIINSTTTNLVFAAGGTYRHELDGGAIPIATWNASSNCTITGLINTEPSGDGQAFGNLTYNSSGMTGNIDMAANGLSIAGNFQVINTGTGLLRMVQTPLTVSGNCIISDDFRMADNTSRTLNVNGDFTLNGGLLDMCSGNNGNIGTLNVTGNFNHIGGTLSESGSGTASGAIVFNKSGTQIFTSGGTVANTINYTVNSGSTLQMASATTVVAGNSFILSSSATLGIRSTAGITAAVATLTGNIQTTGTRTFNTGASYIYNGSVAQAVGTGLPATVSNLTLNNAAVTTLAQATTIANNFSIATGSIANLGTFTHTAGILTLGGEGTVPGSWGSTTSAATNKDNTYFAATGIVNNGCTAPVISTQPAALTICQNSGGNFGVTTSASNPTYQWQYSTDAGVNWSSTNGVAGFSGHTSSSLTLANISVSYNGYRVRCIVRSSSGCRTNSNSVLLTVDVTPTAPIIGTITQPTCTASTASVVLNGLPTGNWQLTRNPGSVITTGTGTSTIISGLAAGTTYTYAVNSLNSGLKANYYNNMTLSGVPVLTRTDATIDFPWGNGSPDSLINNDLFSVRWTGFVQPLYSQTYTFTTRSDDGIRLWVNGVQIINNWTNHAATDNTGTIALTAGVNYSIVLEYYENSGQAVSQLSWSSTSQALQIIPNSQLFSDANCTSPASVNVVINAQPSTPSAPTGSADQYFCSAATVANLVATGTAIQWYASITGGTALASTTVLTNGTHYYATQRVGDCESTSRFDVTAKVNSTPIITPNKVDETCPSSNNGTISPTLSGGLTNIRYIKLTQKFNDFQQVAEIQAFEIFTGTNVALATNGAVASSKSIYNDNQASFGPQLAINGVLTSSPTPATPAGFYHSKGTLDEWIIVDLQSGKNLDKLILFNRTDCCSTRGQNMLLELFDASNNLVYSKTVDLWQSGANLTEINILDVSWADGATSLNRNALDSGTYTLNYADAVGCSVTSPIVIGAKAPTIETSTQPNCKTPTGTITVTSPSPAAGITYTITGTNPVVAAVTNTTGVFSGLAAGNYNVTATNGCTSSPATAVIAPFVLVTNTWNVDLVSEVGSWSEGTPNSSQAIIFNGDFNEFTDIEACSCTVNADVYVNINSGHTLTLTNELNVLGTILFKDKSSLVQINDVINTGKIEYERKVSNTIRPTDYTYWSSPVAGFTLGDVYLEDSKGLFYSYGVIGGIENWRKESAAKVMGKGIGYIINGAKPGGPSYKPPTFIGVPNNGDILVPIVHTGAAVGTSCLLGNPYPSAIDADAFLSTNSSFIEGTLYFWTHNTAIQDRNLISNPGSGAYAYTSDDYASYNFTGGVGIGSGTGSISGSATPSGKIAAGQGFFATAKATGTVKFTNAMRVDNLGNTLDNSQFFKTRNPDAKTTKTIEKSRIWLNLTNTQGAFKQTLVGYVTDATNDHDERFDGESFDANEFVDFYSVNQAKNFVIQGRALPFDENDEVPLGFRTKINGAFTINIDQVDGSLTNQAVFIEDKLTNTVFDLKSGNYTFNTVAGTFNNRFVLKYSNKTLGTNTFDSLEKMVLVSNKNKQIKIDSALEMIDKVTVFDLLGRQIYQKTNVDSNELSISNLVASRQVLIVKTLLQNGQEVSNKIVY